MNSEMMFKVMLAIGQTFVFFAVGAAAVKCRSAVPVWKSPVA